MAMSRIRMLGTGKGNGMRYHILPLVRNRNTKKSMGCVRYHVLYNTILTAADRGTLYTCLPNAVQLFRLTQRASRVYLDRCLEHIHSITKERVTEGDGILQQPVLCGITRRSPFPCVALCVAALLGWLVSPLQQGGYLSVARGVH